MKSLLGWYCYVECMVDDRLDKIQYRRGGQMLKESIRAWDISVQDPREMIWD